MAAAKVADAFYPEVPYLGYISKSPELRRRQPIVSAAGEADSVFASLAYEASRRCELLDKPLRIRVSLWLEKLARAQTRNATWQRLRNDYARALVSQLASGRLTPPFDHRPPEGPLPGLPAWMRMGVGRAFGAGAGAGGIPGGGVGPSAADGGASRRLFEASVTARATPGGATVANDASGLGSASGPGSGSTKWREALAAADAARSAGASAPRRFVHAASDDVDRVGLGGPRSRAETEAALGAARERNVELGWRLRAAEDRLRDSTLHLSRMAGRAGADDAADAGYRAGLVAAAGEVGSGAEDADEPDAWLRSMREFRRQTDLLRKQIGLIGSGQF